MMHLNVVKKSSNITCICMQKMTEVAFGREDHYLIWLQVYECNLIF